MIHLSTEKIKLKSSSQELFDFLGQTSNMAEIISFKKTKHVQVNGDNITFILIGITFCVDIVEVIIVV